MLTMRMMMMKMVTTTTTPPVSATMTTPMMNSGLYDTACEHYGLETISEARNAYSMPTHSIIGSQSKRSLNTTTTTNNNNHNTDWRSGSKDYHHHHHSRTVHFHDVFTPSSSVCSSLQSTMSEFEDGNEMTNSEHNSCCVHVLSASAPTTNYSLNSLINLSKCSRETASYHNNTIVDTNYPNTNLPSTKCTFTPSSYSFSSSMDKPDHDCDDKDVVVSGSGDNSSHHINIRSPSTFVNHSGIMSKTICSSYSSSCCCCFGAGGGLCFCPSCCSCCLCRGNNHSQPPLQHRLPAKRACRSTSSSSDIPQYTSSSLSSSSSMCGYYSRQCPFTSIHLPHRHCHQCYQQPTTSSSGSSHGHYHCHHRHDNSTCHNSNHIIMMRTMQSYIKNLPRPVAVRLDSQAIYHAKSKSCTNMNVVKSSNLNDNNNNNNGDDDISNDSTLRNNNSGVILRPKPSDLISFNKIGNTARLSWHHPLFNFSSVLHQGKHSNNNDNNLSLQVQSNTSTLQHDTSLESQQTCTDCSQNVQKSVRLRNANTRGSTTTTTTNSNNSSNPCDRVSTFRPPNHIEIKGSQDSALSIHALPSPSSAFTPTRTFFDSFPIGVNSLEFSLSPAAGSISSSVQIAARTPSSGFHEASFSGLSEASSLPDCSRFGVSSDTAANSKYCHCHCHYSRDGRDHHRRCRGNKEKESDDKKLSSQCITSTQLTDLESCFKLEDSEPNNNNNNNNNSNNNQAQHDRNSSSSSNSSGSSNSSNSSYSFPSTKCMLRCCSQPNDTAIYDTNRRHLLHCPKHIKETCHSVSTTSSSTTFTPIIPTDITNSIQATSLTPTSAAAGTTTTTTGLKRRRGPSGEYAVDYFTHHNYDNSNILQEKEESHDEILPCACVFYSKPTDHIMNNYDVKLSSNKDDQLRDMSLMLSNTTLDDNLEQYHHHHHHHHHHGHHHHHHQFISSNCYPSNSSGGGGVGGGQLSSMSSYHDPQHTLFPLIDQYPLNSFPASNSISSSTKHLFLSDTYEYQDDCTLIESDHNDEHNSAKLNKRCTHPNSNTTINYNDNNNNGSDNNIEIVDDCYSIETVNPCQILHENENKYNACGGVSCAQGFKYSPDVFVEDNFIHRYTCNELGKLSEMTEDEKEHETPETMIEEGSDDCNSSSRLSDINCHHSEVLLTSPSIHDITFTPICPPPNNKWDISDNENNPTFIIPVHNHPVETNPQDNDTDRQVILFTPSSTRSNSGGESDDMETILSPQMPNRQRICSDVLVTESNTDNKQVLSFTDLDLELIEND
ncbi:unnamed protein product [Heterobilharzia americana]|nr:unnamed protein product [Heterobilharzia americana]